MRAAEKTKLVFRRALQAQRHAVDAFFGHRFEEFEQWFSGICLKRDFGVFRQIRRRGIEEPAQPFRAEECRRPAAEIQRIRRKIRGRFLQQTQLFTQRVHIGVERFLVCAHREKITVRALRFAKRDMQIKANRFVFHKTPLSIYNRRENPQRIPPDFPDKKRPAANSPWKGIEFPEADAPAGLISWVQRPLLPLRWEPSACACAAART